MSVEFKARDRGIWLYRERDYCLEAAVDLDPIKIEQFLALISGLLKSQLRGGFLSQIAGSRNSEGSLFSLKMSQDLGKGREDKILEYSLSTDFFSYENLSVLTAIKEREQERLFNSLTSSQIIRQVGLTFVSLSFGVKFYSSKSHISKWFKVPMEEGNLSVTIEKSKIISQAIIRKNCDEKSLKFVKDVFSLIAELSFFDIHVLENYWQLDRSIS